jgi:NitT/TauT family transport system substrate-binding protein
LQAHPDKYVRFLRGIYRAVDYFEENRDEAVEIIASHFSITPEEFEETLPNFRYTSYEEAVELMGTEDDQGRAYEVFREAMVLNLDFGSSDVELVAEDHITTSIIQQVEKNW